uniref:Uncharacterized protein n=1 Tax=Cajanus cajan TaxID=3821 RepID=A0A151TXY2_CAJCA|nr:hypothetical protein KK1_011213 [Cajanus cajan]
MCGFESRNSRQVHCFFDYRTGGSQHGLGDFGIITLSIVGSAIICAIGMACYVSFKYKRGNTANIGVAQRSTTTAISPTPTRVVKASSLEDEPLRAFHLAFQRPKHRSYLKQQI